MESIIIDALLFLLGFSTGTLTLFVSALLATPAKAGFSLLDRTFTSLSLGGSSYALFFGDAVAYRRYAITTPMSVSSTTLPAITTPAVPPTLNADEEAAAATFAAVGAYVGDPTCWPTTVGLDSTVGAWLADTSISAVILALSARSWMAAVKAPVLTAVLKLSTRELYLLVTAVMSLPSVMNCTENVAEMDTEETDTCSLLRAKVRSTYATAAANREVALLTSECTTDTLTSVTSSELISIADATASLNTSTMTALFMIESAKDASSSPSVLTRAAGILSTVCDTKNWATILLAGVGSAEGRTVGGLVGGFTGLDGIDGVAVGARLGLVVGLTVGVRVGLTVGAVGRAEGAADGSADGIAVGSAVGVSVGTSVGANVGASVGSTDEDGTHIDIDDCVVP
jgi:hypothetical protein